MPVSGGLIGLFPPPETNWKFERGTLLWGSSTTGLSSQALPNPLSPEGVILETHYRFLCKYMLFGRGLAHSRTNGVSRQVGQPQQAEGEEGQQEQMGRLQKETHLQRGPHSSQQAWVQH